LRSIARPQLGGEAGNGRGPERDLEELRKGSFVEQGADKKYRLTTKGRKEILILV
jgi:hypothetical protein